MSIGKSRRELKLLKVVGELEVNPSISNIELANKVGIHRNTVARYLWEIQQRETENASKKRSEIMANLERNAEAIRLELMGLWSDAYHNLYDSKPIQLVEISKAKWQMEKELARIRLLKANSSPFALEVRT